MPHHDVETPQQVSILESTKKTSKRKFSDTDVNSDLTVSSSQKIQFWH
jgi:hypothetical protein